MNLCWANRLQGLVLLMLLWGGPAVCAQEAAQEKPPASEPIVHDIRIVKQDGTVLKANPPGISVPIGAPLDPEQVAASIRTLYKTGDFANIIAQTTPLPDGVRLDFRVQENLFINRVVVEGLKPPPTDASALGAMQLSLGQTYREADVQEALSRLRDTLRDEGLYQAKVSVEQQANPETHQLDVIARVTPGPRVRLSTIELINNTEYSDGELLKLFKLRAGSELTVARVQSAVERIRKFMQKKDHLSASVSVRRGTYQEGSNSLGLTLEVNAGPIVQLSVQGAKFSKRELKTLIPVFQEASVDPDLLEEGKRNLLERLEREGYFDARVEYKISSSTGKSGSELTVQAETTVYTVERGPLYKSLRIEITGNRYFGKELLLSRLSIAPSSLFVKPKFSRRLLDADVVSMRNLYASNGFLSANVVAVTPKEAKEKTGELVVRFEITEGKQTLVAGLKLEGMHAIPEQTLRGVLGSLPGQPYSEISVASDRDNILALYYNEGFPNATFSWTATPATSESPGDEEKDTSDPSHPPSAAPKDPPIERAEPMNLVYKIDEGQRVIVRQVLLSGYFHTRRYIMERQIRLLKAGEPLREGDVIASQQKLYNLGVFNRVTIDAQNAAGSNPEKDVVVLVEEAKRYTIAYGGGFEAQRLASTTDPTGGEVQASPRGIFEIAKQNVTGRADTLALKIRGSTIQGRALLAYTAPQAPYFEKLSFQATAYVEKSQDINTYSQTRYEGNLQLTDQLTPRSSWLFRYAFRKVTLSNLNIPPQEVPLFNQPTLVSEFSTTWYRDTRDNPADANKGSFNTADFSVASTAIGSSASFLRLFLQNSTYRHITRNWSFARSIRIVYDLRQSARYVR